MIFVAASLFSCDNPPVPTMSLQCAVSNLNQHGFDLQPYEGDIESDCNKLMGEYRVAFYDAMGKDVSTSTRIKSIASWRRANVRTMKSCWS